MWSPRISFENEIKVVLAEPIGKLSNQICISHLLFPNTCLLRFVPLCPLKQLYSSSWHVTKPLGHLDSHSRVYFGSVSCAHIMKFHLVTVSQSVFLFPHFSLLTGIVIWKQPFQPRLSREVSNFETSKHHVPLASIFVSYA